MLQLMDNNRHGGEAPDTLSGMMALKSIVLAFQRVFNPLPFWECF